MAELGLSPGSPVQSPCSNYDSAVLAGEWSPGEDPLGVIPRLGDLPVDDGLDFGAE